MWEIEYTDEFEEWWNTLSEGLQIDITVTVDLLSQFGRNLQFPYSSGIKNSHHSHLRELRIQHSGKPYRIFYAFDPRRVALLLIGGGKSGKNRWYETMIPLVDKLYSRHLKALELEEN